MTGTPPTIGIAGFGRCGSTMVMRMLIAGGVPVVDGCERPPHELDELGAIETCGDLRGRCVKVLNSIMYYRLPTYPRWRFVWLDRDPLQQACSHIKFMIGCVAAPPEQLGDAIRRLMRSYPKDRPRTLGRLHGLGTVTVMQYERVLADPLAAARRLAELWPSLDVAAAAAVVHDRDGTCRPDLSVELEMMTTGRS